MTDENPALTSLVYTSTAIAPFRESALSHLLGECRALNGDRDVTGMLLYRNERFIQILEGPRETVRALAKRIARDPRHRDMRILLDEPIDARRFAEWTMGYRSLNDHLDDAPAGFRDSFADLDDGVEGSDAIRALSELTLWFRVRSGDRATASHG